MGDITDHFSRSEFRCKCGKCEEKEVSLYLVWALEKVRYAIGKPIIITSGIRCPAHNAAVGGATASKHMLGMAADIMVRGMHTCCLEAVIQAIAPELRTIIYTKHVHVNI